MTDTWDPEELGPGSAADYAGQLSGMAATLLEKAGHRDCPYLKSATYLTDERTVVCGCGHYQATESDTEVRGEVMHGGHVALQAQDPILTTLALIDPTQVYTPEQVEQHILEVLYRLETGALFERECILAAEAAASAFNRLYFATVHTSQETSELKRKAEAEVRCQEAGLTSKRDETKMLAAAAKATMHNLRAVLSGYQSTAKSISVAYQGGGSAGPTGRNLL